MAKTKKESGDLGFENTTAMGSSLLFHKLEFWCDQEGE
jgi:hypothetical protein